MTSDIKLQLAVAGGETFVFSGAEIPEKISFGGSQKLVKHELVGGRRVVDAMGRADMALAWSGYLLGQSALQRARFLDTLRASGRQAVLTWSELSYVVVVEEFSADFERYFKLPYHISLAVVADQAQPVNSTKLAGVDETVRADNSTAQTLGANIGDGTLSTQLDTLDKAIRAVSNFATASRDAIAAVTTPINAIQQRVGILLASAGNTAQNLASFGGNLGANNAGPAAAAFSANVAAAGQLASLINLNALLARMQKNLGTPGK